MKFSNHIITALLVHVVVYGGFWVLYETPVSLGALLLIVAFVWISVIDFLRYEIPDLAVVMLVSTGLLLLHVGLSDRLLAFSGGALWFMVFWLVSVVFETKLGRPALGFGDVKLMFGVGCCLGVFATLYVVLLASVAGVATILCLRVISGRKNAEDQVEGIAFGPFLCLSAWVIWLNHFVQ